MHLAFIDRKLNEAFAESGVSIISTGANQITADPNLAVAQILWTPIPEQQKIRIETFPVQEQKPTIETLKALTTHKSPTYSR